MTGNKTLDFIISLLFWAAVVWTLWDALAKQRAKKRRAQERAEAIASGQPVPQQPPGNWFDAWFERNVTPWLEKKFGPRGGEAKPGEGRVFGDELGRWPVVRHVAPGVLVMKAPYVGPRRVQNFSGWKPPVLTGLALGVLNWLRFKNVLVTPEQMAWSIGGTGIYAALFSIPFWWLARKTRLVIRFDQGAMSWRGPDWKKHVVGPAEPRSLQVIVPHRWADEERRLHDNWRQTHPGRGSPKALFQTASELVMHTGRGGMQWRTVAEFCNDLSGEQAHRLQTAIDLVTERAAEELAAGAREAANTGPL